MKQYLLSALLFLFVFSSFSQSKMNYGAALAAHNPSQQETMLPLLIKGNPSEVERIVTKYEGEYRYSEGDISSVTLKAKYIELVASRSFVQRIEAKNPYSKLQPMHDSMLVNNNVVKVHAGTPPLAQAYLGDSVVIGFIDTGIDFTHPDFKTSAGKTRIKFLWDQTLSTQNPPLPYNYGREYNSNAIDNNFATPHLSTAATNGGHGTHVASEAAGNGLAINKYKGVAPNTDIIFVAVDFNNANGISDAASYIYSKAASLGKPCVINCSLGDYIGSHDGKDLQAQLIKNLITAQSGRSFVAAAGNGGTFVYHLGYTVSNTDTNFTWFNNASGPYIGMYADSNNFKNIQFAIGADVPSPGYNYRGRTAFSTVTPHIGVLGYDTIWNGTNRLCTIQTYGDSMGGVYSMEFSIMPDSTNYNWRLMTTGSGKFDEWSFDVVTATLSDSTVFSPLKKYKQPDNNENIVSSFQCLDEVLAVGNYINRNQHVDYDTVLQVNSSITAGALEASSSHGPTRDGRIKPEIAAPGNYMLGCIVLSLFNTYAHSSLAIGGKHRIGSGTSAASPTVAGIAALLLEQNPTADWKQVKNSIMFCSRTDSFTGSGLPNNLWGYGKADAFLALTNCATLSDNWNEAENNFTIYPDPANSEFTISNIQFPAQLQIFNSLGKIVLEKKIEHKQETINLNEPNGIYFCVMKNEKGMIAVKKMIISK